MKKYFSIFLVATFVLLGISFAKNVQATKGDEPSLETEKTINSVLLNGATTVTVLPNSTINVSVNATNGDHGNFWESTQYQIGNDEPFCENTTNVEKNYTTDSRNFNISSPGVAGEYSFKIWVYTGGCNNKNREIGPVVLTNAIVVVNSFDTTPPVITINPYNTTPTNQDVVVTASTNEGTLNTTSHTFTENGSFDFIATDAAGNSTTQTVTISNIDKIAPVITITNPDGNPAQNKTITALMNKEGTLSMSINGSSVCDATLTFTDYSSTTFSSEEDNGKFVCYRAIDQAGNTTYQSSQAISGIDTIALITGISYSTTEWTNKDVIATLNQSEPITITNNGGSNTYTFSDNGSFVFEFTDAAGNTGTATASVSNIDKIVPTITLNGADPVSLTVGDSYIEAGATANDAVDGTIIVTPSGTVDTNTTGTYTITYTATDVAGNMSTKTRTVNVAAQDQPEVVIPTPDPTPDPEPVQVTHRSSGGYLRPVNTGRTTGGQVLGAETFVFTLPLKLGSRGAEVTELQKRLIADGYLKITTPTGYFGTLTQKAVKAFQKAHGLVADGVVGPETRLALNK